ncbi:PAS domain S-box protein [Lutibacter sp.]|uniref:hybrid sensor histidine kinase/response regulator n=1 Tax=Lutibacter sp. TaxID=1925666 RepID=UPI001A35683F|nr:PAS domain S-box protein [Lutibacter sp.]MBI9041103.1 PAS domain S-box protein [Lutibacter sp.]
MVDKYIDKTLEFIANYGYKINDGQFLNETAIFLSELLNVNYVLIDKYSIEEPTIAKIECFYSKKLQKFLPKDSYSLVNTPCENVINKTICSYPSNTKNLFFKDLVLTELNIESYIGIPLWNSKKEPIGLIAIMDEKPTVNVKIVETIIQIIAIKIEKVLEKIIFEEQINSKNDDIETSQKNFNKLSNLTFEGILIHDNGKAIDVNKAFAKMFGYKKEELIGKNVFELLFDKRYHSQVNDKRNSSPALPYEIEGIKKDKTTFFIEIESKSIQLNHSKNARVAAIRDISKRKLAENRLQEAQQIAKVGSFVYDISSGEWESTPVLDEILGINESFEKNYESLSKFIYSDDLQTILVDIKDLIQLKLNFYNKEYRILRQDNNKIGWINTLGKLEFDAQGNPIKIIGTVQDITVSKNNQQELKQAKEKAEESEKKLFEAQKIAGVGTYTFDLNLDYWSSSLILKDIFGIDSSYNQNLDGWLALIHPEDSAEMISYLKNDILTKHGFFDKQYRIIRDKDKEIRWVHGFGKLNCDDKGNPIQLIGTIQDITSTIKIQEELKKAKLVAEESELLFKSLIKYAGDAMYLADFEGNIIEVNNKTIENSGYSRKELLTMNAKELEAEFKELDKKKLVWNKLTNKNQITIETFHKRKNGTVFPVEINIAMLKIGAKKLLLGFARDISERKKISNEIKLLSTAVNQSANSIIITDTKGNIEFTNPKFSEIMGYSAEEILGKNAKILKSGFHDTDFYKNLWSTIFKGNTWQGQFKNKSKNGDLIWEQTTITPIKNDLGVITNFLAIKEDITEQKKSETNLTVAYAKIQESQEYLRKILETANEGFWIIDSKGITTDVNIKMCSILGYEKDDFRNKSIFDFVNDKNKKIFKEQIKLREQGLSTTYEIELIKKNGNKVICLFNTSPIFDSENNRKGSFALVTDITKLNIATDKLKSRNHELSELSVELYESNKLLKESSSRFLSIFEQTPITIMEEDFSEVIKLIKQKKSETSDFKKYLDDNLDFVKECISKIKILNVNSTTLNLFGVSNLNELVKHLRTSNNKKSYEALKREFVAIANGEIEFKTEAEFINTKGEKINAYVKLAIVDDYGKAIATIIDITNLKNTEKELIIAKEKAEESNRLKTEFLNNMSHEIRTPMNGILGFSELLNNAELSPAKRNYFVSIIQNSGKQLLQVIDDILEISRLGTKQVKVIETKVCLNDLLLELFSIFDLKAKENGVPLYIKNQLSDCESTIYTDKTKLQKIISNLLENALKFTNKGYITFGYNLVEDSIEIFVKDTGIGIKEEKQHIIFERFSQEERDVSRNASGLGLGLAIAKENTELLGGEISVESVKWEGSTFWVKLPYKPVKNPNLENNKCEKEINVRSKYKVLVVEDEEVNYLFIEIVLLDKIQLNCEIIHAKNGKEAVEFCEEFDDIDFVLMDINMPIMNGYDATLKIKEFRPNLPIIAQTAYSTPEDKEKAFNAGCNDFISKPLNKDLLKTIIDSHLVEDI